MPPEGVRSAVVAAEPGRSLWRSLGTPRLLRLVERGVGGPRRPRSEMLDMLEDERCREAIVIFWSRSPGAGESWLSYETRSPTCMTSRAMSRAGARASQLRIEGSRGLDEATAVGPLKMASARDPVRMAYGSRCGLAAAASPGSDMGRNEGLVTMQLSAFGSSRGAVGGFGTLRKALHSRALASEVKLLAPSRWRWGSLGYTQYDSSDDGWVQLLPSRGRELSAQRKGARDGKFQ